ncbi:tripartite tricarboxylate transporter substrate binding protein [Ramlibacter sp. XY19]|uniref:Bug family tripartite tricarboxylate transporter substrate binding protein n=1 Tax=Ramlibacter paludis TaxID=2908000 RepID=UPI0023D98D65|nr:tripartite tricarboxylate transporter substrate binding protein [Ramlibacter paludis]MCG2591492.1 tripartite tricarboxylate transporter substrate binding protein [Ramlibacter paludis]
MKSFISRRAVIAAAVLSTFGLAVHAQAWPAKPIRLVVAGPAGGSADILARLVSEPMAKELGQPVVVDNKVGAGGAIAVQDIIQSPHDGYTLLVGVSSLVSEVPHIVKLKFDMAKELRPLAELGRGGLVLVANPTVPAANLKDLVAYAKKNPRLVYASYSPGSLSHVMGQQLAQAAGIELVHAGYKGSTTALTDVMGNHVPLMFDGVPTSLPLIKGGKIKALAVSTPARLPQLPDVPTFREAGYPQLEALAWMGLWSAPDVPAAVQQRVRAAALKALADPALRAKVQETGFDVGQPRTSDEMQKGLAVDYERIGGVLNAIGFKPE